MDRLPSMFQVIIDLQDLPQKHRLTHKELSTKDYRINFKKITNSNLKIIITDLSNKKTKALDSFFLVSSIEWKPLSSSSS